MKREMRRHCNGRQLLTKPNDYHPYHPHHHHHPNANIGKKNTTYNFYMYVIHVCTLTCILYTHSLILYNLQLLHTLTKTHPYNLQLLHVTYKLIHKFYIHPLIVIITILIVILLRQGGEYQKSGQLISDLTTEHMPAIYTMCKANDKKTNNK